MAKYVKALDHMLVAAQAYRQGKFELAAKQLEAAAAHPSFVLAHKLINQFNEGGLAVEAAAKKKKVVKKPARKTKASTWPFPVNAEAEGFSTDDNGELGIEVEENDMREVQEAAGEDDLDYLGELSLDDELSELETSEAEGEEGEGEEDEAKEDGIEQARFVRALRNQRAQKTAASRLKTK